MSNYKQVWKNASNITHVAFCNETPWGREQCLLGNCTTSPNRSQARLFMKYIASVNEESQVRFDLPVKLFLQESKHVSKKNKRKMATHLPDRV